MRNGSKSKSKSIMGQRKKVHSLPPLEKSNSRSQSLGVDLPDRQRLIGSPAPHILKKMNQRKDHDKRSLSASSEFPTITLSVCEDSKHEKSHLSLQRDSVVEVGEVGSGKPKTGGTGGGGRPGSNLSILSIASMASIGNMVEQYKNVNSRSALTPPPRVISMRDSDGNHVVTEWAVPGIEQQQATEGKSEETIGGPGADREVISKPNLPSLGGDVRLGSSLPSKYPPLEPIKSRERSRHRRSSTK